MGCGTLLLRDPMDACRVEQAANYIIREDSWDQGRFSLEGSRPANAPRSRPSPWIKDVEVRVDICRLSCIYIFKKNIYI